MLENMVMRARSSLSERHKTIVRGECGGMPFLKPQGIGLQRVICILVRRMQRRSRNSRPDCGMMQWVTLL